MGGMLGCKGSCSGTSTGRKSMYIVEPHSRIETIETSQNMAELHRAE